MVRKRHTPEQVIKKLREAEVAIAEGSTVAEAALRYRRDRADLLPLAQRVWGVSVSNRLAALPVRSPAGC